MLGASLVQVEPFNLSEPVYVILGREEGRTDPPVPAWWDPRANSGLGGWDPAHCTLMRYSSVQCFTVVVDCVGLQGEPGQCGVPLQQTGPVRLAGSASQAGSASSQHSGGDSVTGTVDL